jgi:hypothetical protein
MNDFFERLKNDRLLQIILIFILISFITIFNLIIKPLFFPKKVQKSCYNEQITIWTPFESDKIIQYISPLSEFCLQFNVIQKPVDQIHKDLIYALAKENFPDIVIVDNYFLKNNQDLFSTTTPIYIDSLIAFYNQNILNFLNLEKPKTLEELKEFIKKIKNYKKDFYPFILGTKNVKNYKEIILTLMTLNPNYQEISDFKNNLLKALDIYFSFNDPKNDFFLNVSENDNDLINFANEKSALYFGFYEDKKEILKINPTINISYELLPLNTFPPKAKIYSKTYYLAIVKKSKLKSLDYFHNWFLNKALPSLINDFDLVPFKENENISKEKTIVINSVKNFGELFDFIDKEKLFYNFDKIMDSFNNKYELNYILERIFY